MFHDVVACSGGCGRVRDGGAVAPWVYELCEELRYMTNEHRELFLKSFGDRSIFNDPYKRYLVRLLWDENQRLHAIGKDIKRLVDELEAPSGNSQNICGECYDQGRLDAYKAILERFEKAGVTFGK